MRTSAIFVVSLSLAFGLARAGSAQDAAGVGVALGKEGDDIVVRFLLPAGSAAASKAVHVGDRIIAVGQENGDDKSVKGLKIGEVVPQLRGPEGTTVRVTIVPAKKPEAEAFVITLTRGALKELAAWGDGALLKQGDEAPDIAYERLDGKGAEQLAVHAGKVVVLEFGSISCGPCQAKMDDLQRDVDTHPEWKGKVALIGVFAVDEDKAAVLRHVQAKGWNKTLNVFSGPDAMKAYHVNAIPTIYVIDQQGRVVDGSHSLDVPMIVNRLLSSN